MSKLRIRCPHDKCGAFVEIEGGETRMPDHVTPFERGNNTYDVDERGSAVLPPTRMFTLKRLCKMSGSFIYPHPAQ